MATRNVYAAIKSNGAKDEYATGGELVRIFFNAATAYRFAATRENVSILKVSGVNTSAPEESRITLTDLRFIIDRVCDEYGFCSSGLKYQSYIEYVFSAY